MPRVSWKRGGGRVSINGEKRKPLLSISLEESVSDKFKLAVSNNNLTVSQVVREMILEYIKKNGS